VCLPECELFSCIYFFFLSSLLPFCVPGTILQAKLIFCGCTVVFYRFSFVILTHFQPPLSISGDDHIHHKIIGIFLLSPSAISNTKIVTILILESACVSHASQSKPTAEQALNQAYSRYCASSTHNEVTQQFSATPNNYSVLQLTDFILRYRLS
jgi:hypothetical protein